MKKAGLILVLMIFSASMVWGDINESFETGLPTSYTTETEYNLSSGTWTGSADKVIRGTEGVNTGDYSCQLRSQTGAQITTPTLAGGVGAITFYVTGSTTSGGMQIKVSEDDGVSWDQVTGSPISFETTKEYKVFAVNNPNVDKVQFYRTGATVYIDDVVITQYQEPILPKVIISEVADHSTYQREYIEIYNTDGESVNIDGWVIKERYNNNNTDERSMTLNATNQINTEGTNYLTLESGEYAVILRDSGELSGFKSTYSISNNVAIFSGNVPQMNGNERYKLENSTGATIDYFGDWDRSPIFEVTSSNCYERINGADSDGQLEVNWKMSANNVYTYTPGSSNDTPLPVTLSSFTANCESGQPVLVWVTESETENLGWNLYRSSEENGFETNNFLLLNETLIPGMGTTTQPSSYSFVDEYTITSAGTYWYWLQSVSYSGELEIFGPVSLLVQEGGIPALPQFSGLQANYPNPFNPTTTIEFSIREGDTGLLSIYNARGQKIMENEFPAGNHLFNWNADNQASGVYFYQLQTPNFLRSRKMILVK